MERTDEELGFEEKEDGDWDAEAEEEGYPYVTLTLMEVGVCYSLKEQSSCTHIQLNSLSLTDHSGSGIHFIFPVSYLIFFSPGVAMEPVVLVETDKEFLIIDWEHVSSVRAN